MNDQINEYLENLSESDIRKVAANTVEHLYELEELGFYPEEDGAPAVLYWPGSGEDVRGDLR